MKRLFLSVIVALLFVANGYSQVPQSVNYQAVVRDASGNAVASGTSVSVRFTIHDGGIQGTVVFTEVQHPVTNQFGLISLQMGTFSDLSHVPWGTGQKYLQVEIDPAGGSNFTDMGTSQLASVPYALFAANSANGPPGSTGPTGAQGDAGATGVAGPQGATGTQGPAGPQGATGSQGSAGQTGLQGQQGVAGPQGVAGSVGPQGNPGVAGPTGVQGAAGPAGVQGQQGVQGPTGANGVTGTTGLQGNTGPTGLQGTAGTAGAQGPTGLQGIAGVDGATGLQGPTGNNGLQGVTGATGNDGAMGATGPQGAVGNDGLQGVTGPTGNDGAMGATGPQGATGNDGAQGITGPTGNDGAVGATGPSGQDGAQGVTGATGNDGAMGATGPQGATGQDGAQGSTGPTGNDGAQGVTGPTGNDGVMGATGLQGATGNDGLQGSTGATGNDGAIGATGPAGQDGVGGTTGATGNGIVTAYIANDTLYQVTTDGDTTNVGYVTGATGPAGDTGVAGPMGPTGPAGANGTNGGNCLVWNNGDASTAGFYSYNSVIFSNITQVQLNNSTAAGADATQWLGNIAPGSTLQITLSDDPTQFGIYSVTGNSVNGGVYTFSLSFISGNGLLTSTANFCYTLSGAAGAQGVTGPTGANGNDGAQGATGATGPSGQDGAAGATGPQGPSGQDGVAGVTGPTGATGNTGFLQPGIAAGNTPYWNGSQWITDSSNIYNAGANVGINTTNPQYQLDVNGNTRINGNIYGSGNGTDFYIVQGILGVDDGGSIHMDQSGGLKMLSLDGSNTGINVGFSNGQSVFSANNSGHSYPQVSIGDANDLYNHTQITINDSSRAIIIPNGKVGIGTTTPGAALEVDSTFRYVDGNQGAGKILVSDSFGTAKWQQAPSESPWITIGNDIFDTYLGDSVGIGTPTPTAKLEVNGDIKIDGNVRGTGVGTDFSIFQGTGPDAGALINMNDSGGIAVAAAAGQTLNLGFAFVGNAFTAQNTTGNISVAMGDVSGTTSGMAVKVNAAPSSRLIQIGGLSGTNNGTQIVLDDVHGYVTIPSGFVGIGTTQPLGAFQVDGTPGSTQLQVFSNNVLLGDLSGTQNKMKISVDNGSRKVLLGDYGDQMNGTAITIDDANTIITMPAGEVGIGTNSPSAKLEVDTSFRYVDGNQQAGYVLTSDSFGNATWQTPSAGLTTWDTSNGNIYNANAGGNVGINNPTPGVALDVIGSISGFNANNSTGMGIGVVGVGPTVGVVGVSISSDAPNDQYTNYFGGKNIEQTSGVSGLASGDPNPDNDALGAITFGVVGQANNTNNGDDINIGVFGEATNSAWQQIGVMGVINSGYTGIQNNANIQGPNAALMGIDNSGTGGNYAGYFKGHIAIVDGSQTNGYVLTSDSFGNASWQAPAGAGPWTAIGSTIYNNFGNNVGINTSTPGANLEVDGGDLGVFASVSGNNGVNISLPMQHLLGANAEDAGILGTAGNSGSFATFIDYGVVGQATQIDGDPYKIGVLGEAANGEYGQQFGVVGVIDAPLGSNNGYSAAVMGVDNSGTTGNYAGYFQGHVAIADGSQQNGYVLTSDSFGNASWQPGGAGGGFWSPSGSNITNNNAGMVGIGIAPSHELTVQGDIQIGDAAETINGTLIRVNPIGGVIQVGDADGISGGTQMVMLPPIHETVIGDVTAGRGGTAVFINDSTHIISIGDVYSWNNLTTLTVNDSSGLITTHGHLQLTGINENNNYVLTSDSFGNASWEAPTGGGGGGQWVDSSGNIYNANIMGNVGIGTSNPQYTLDVNGNINAKAITASGSYMALSATGEAIGIYGANNTSINGSGEITSYLSQQNGANGEAVGIWGNAAGDPSDGGAFGTQNNFGMVGQSLLNQGSNVNVGIYGEAGNSQIEAVGIMGVINSTSTAASGANAAVMGIDNSGTGGNYAGYFQGHIAIVDGSQHKGYVLTSDSLGSATWQTPTAGGFTLPFTDTLNVPSYGLNLVSDSEGTPIIGTFNGIVDNTGGATGIPAGILGTSMVSNGAGVVGFNWGGTAPLQFNTIFNQDMGVVGVSDNIGVYGYGVSAGVNGQGGYAGVLGTNGNYGTQITQYNNLGTEGAGVWGNATGDPSQGYISDITNFGVVGTSNQQTEGGAVLNIGVYGEASHAGYAQIGVMGVINSGYTGNIDSMMPNVAVMGIDNSQSGTGYAGYFQGRVAIVDATQGAGRVLTSDANGNASWQEPSGSGGYWTADVSGNLSNTNTGNVNVIGGAGTVNLGDVNTVNTGTQIVIDGGNSDIHIGDPYDNSGGTEVYVNTSLNQVGIGDVFDNHNGTTITVDDASSRITTSGTLRITGNGAGGGKVLTSTNNFGDATWQTPTVTTSGTYTPTTSNSSGNVGSVSMSTAQYMRVGNVVTVSGQFTLTANSSGTFSTFQLSLPVASTTSSANMVAGSCTAFNISTGTANAYLDANTVNNTVNFNWVSQSSFISSQTWSYQFTYLIN